MTRPRYALADYTTPDLAARLIAEIIAGHTGTAPLRRVAAEIGVNRHTLADELLTRPEVIARLADLAAGGAP